MGSTLFAVWARLALGSSWSVGPRAATDRGLRTDGPYAITRHPIYTGLLGMLLGSALLGGLGQWIVLVAAGLVVAGLKPSIVIKHVVVRYEGVRANVIGIGGRN